MFEGPRYSSSPVRVIAAASPHRPSVAWAARVTPRRQDTLARIEAGFGISVRTVCTHDGCHLPARRPRPGPLRARRAAKPDYVLLDGTVAKGDRIGDSRAVRRADSRHRRHGANVQVLIDPIRQGGCCGCHPSCPGEPKS